MSFILAIESVFFNNDPVEVEHPSVLRKFFCFLRGSSRGGGNRQIASFTELLVYRFTLIKFCHSIS